MTSVLAGRGSNACSAAQIVDGIIAAPERQIDVGAQQQRIGKAVGIAACPLRVRQRGLGVSRCKERAGPIGVAQPLIGLPLNRLGVVGDGLGKIALGKEQCAARRIGIAELVVVLVGIESNGGIEICASPGKLTAPAQRHPALDQRFSVRGVFTELCRAG
jgi:hypothetical protein